MIPNHNQFLQAIQDKKKIRVKFYSKADNEVIERICAPLDYGPGGGVLNGLSRYWLWDHATLGLLPQQIVDLQVLSEEIDPVQLTGEPWPLPVFQNS